MIETPEAQGRPAAGRRSGMGRRSLEAHLDHLAYLGRRPGTIDQRRRYLLRLARTVEPRGLLEVNVDDVEAFVRRPELGPEARNNAVTHLRGFYRWAIRARLIERDPTIDLDRPRRPRRLPRPIPEAELERAIRDAREPIRVWLLLAAMAGLRCCEIAPLRGEDFTGGLLIIREQKGGDEGTVPVAPDLATALGGLPPRGWWFPRWDRQPGPISPNQLQRYANRWLHSIGIEHTMHTLRHRFVTSVYEASGRDLRVTQELARHRSIASTVGYTWLDPERARETMARVVFPAVPGGSIGMVVSR